MGKYRNINGGVVGQRLQHWKTNGQIIYHQRIASQLHGTPGVLEDLGDLVGYVHGVQGVFTLLLIHLFFNLHISLDASRCRIEGGIGYQLVILDDVAAAERRLSEQFRPNLQRIAGAGLNHVVEQRALLHSQDFPYSFDAEFRSLEASHVLLGEAYVHQLDVAAHGDIAHHCGQQHRYLLTDVDLRVGYLHKPLPGLQIGRHSGFIVRHLVDPDYLGNVLAANIRGLSGYRNPGACALLHGQHGSYDGDGKRCRIGDQICADDIVIVVHSIRQSYGQSQNVLRFHLNTSS